MGTTKEQKKKKIVKTDDGTLNGQVKCPKCGATDISLNINTGHLRCNFCRHEFEPKKVTSLEANLSKLEGEVIALGATDIQADTKDVLTFKCSSCGAEVVIDTASSSEARCHWCRNKLTVNEQIPNGSVPDVVLPFKVKKDEAQSIIAKFVGKRKFFAHPKFRQEFTTNNIMGVYFPYMLIDANLHAFYSGRGEIETRCYTVKHKDHTETLYDADVYHVEREFDLTVNGLTIESSTDKLNTKNKNNTNNVINAIMPFDIENCVKYEANYLTGYTSEKRDTNIDSIHPLMETQVNDISRFACNDTIDAYTRGVSWEDENVNIKGEQWQAAYLPVWLYSYQAKNGVLHYVALNARTKEVMGSVPIHMPKLIFVSCLVELLGLFLMLLTIDDWDFSFLFLLIGFIYFAIIYFKYRNSNAHHTYERETKTDMANLRKKDEFLMQERGLSNPFMMGANNTAINGRETSFFDDFNNNNFIN